MKKILSLILVAIMLVTAMPMAFAEGETYKVGDIIQFGSYPQSEVKDEAIISALNALAPEWDDWTSYGYYSGDGSYGSMVQGDWMRYTDIAYNGNKYRGVKFTQYRPNYTYSSSNNTNQDDNGYSTNTVYWFKFESIDWRVLDPSTGLVMCETIIDSQPYSNTVYYKSNPGYRYNYFNDASYKIFASDYETSFIRKWLNEDFYNTAFTDREKKEISTTTLNNDGYETSIGTIGCESLDSNETKDKIFLLSYNEVRNSNFGFNSSSSAYDTARRAQGSDYAQSQGLYVYRSSGSIYNGNLCWLLRSPGGTSSQCCYVSYVGNSLYSYNVDGTHYGVRPALRFNNISDIGQSEHQHDYSSVVTTPTCTEQGYTTYTCECGDSYVDDYVEAIDHSYTSEITTPATHLKVGVETFTCHCGDTYTKDVLKLTEHTYNSVVTPPTCTEQGYTTYTCECGDSYVDDYIKENGHSHTSEITTPATHLKVGIETFTCHCGDTYTKDVSKLTEHTYNSVVTPPTCTTPGYTTYTCECGDSYIGNFVDERHTFSTEWTIDEDPTCKAEGVKSHHCKFCPARTDITAIDKLEHNFVSVRVEPSCLDEGYIMTGCNCGIETIEVIPAKGHNFNGFSCTECDYDKSFDCSCNCHKSGIPHLFFKIILFFQKLFGQNKVCACGVKH